MTSGVVIVAGSGVDDWRTCAKLTPEQFGVKKDQPFVFLSENDKFCQDDPTAHVAILIVAGLGSESAPLLEAEYKGERAQIKLASYITINAKDLK